MPQQPPDRQREGEDFLAAHGLNLFAALDCAKLPASVLAHWRDAPDLTPYARLVIIGNAGPSLWRALQEDGMAGTDPIDDFSAKTTRHYCRTYLPDAHCQLVFPEPGKAGAAGQFPYSASAHC